MKLTMQGGQGDMQQPPSRGVLGGLLSRKPSKGQSVFEAAGEGDALDALEAGAGRQVVARQGSGSRWGLLSRKGSSSAAREAQLLQQEHDQELAALRADCAAQAAEAAAMRAQLGEAHEELNLQRFKYELLVDLWAMRVLDNEEMAAQQQQQPNQSQQRMGAAAVPAGAAGYY